METELFLADRRSDMAKLVIIAFRNFANSPKKLHVLENCTFLYYPLLPDQGNKYHDHTICTGKKEPVTAEDSARRPLHPLIILHRMSHDRIGSSVVESLKI